MNIHRVLGTVVHILILVLLISLYVNNNKNRTNLIFILCATIVYVCYLLEFVKRPNIMNLETFQAQLDYKMGAYSQLKVNNDNTRNLYDPTSKVKCGERKRPCNIGLHTDIRFDTPMGTEERYIPDPGHNPTMPSVTGNPDDPKSLFTFTHNQCHPDCCPSTYTCDRGCVCTTKEQIDFINKRGKNRTIKSYPDM